MIIYTIGVYGSNEEEFFGKLIDSQIDLFCDIRQRRGVRGRQYAFVNSNYLQNKLAELGIDYLYENYLFILSFFALSGFLRTKFLGDYG